LALFTGIIIAIFVLTRHKESFVKFRYYIAKANNYTINSDYPNALRFAKLAYAAEPNNPEVTFSLASAYYDMKEFKAAEGKFKEIIRISPICVDAYYNLGLLYMEQKRFKEAVPILEKATALDPEDISAHFELGRAYKAGGRKELARDEFNLALKKMNRWRTEEREIIKGELSSLGYE
jgi:tetratricopeptide (TPR) repeat protein